MSKISLVQNMIPSREKYSPKSWGLQEIFSLARMQQMSWFIPFRNFLGTVSVYNHRYIHYIQHALVSIIFTGNVTEKLISLPQWDPMTVILDTRATSAGWVTRASQSQNSRFSFEIMYVQETWNWPRMLYFHIYKIYATIIVNRKINLREIKDGKGEVGGKRQWKEKGKRGNYMIIF